MKEEVRSFLLGQGADVVGFASADRFGGAPDGFRPADILPGAQSVISLAVRIPYGVLDSPSMRLVTNALNSAVNKLNGLLFQAANMLEDKGYRVAPVPPVLPIDIIGKGGQAGEMSHKHAAELAGVGYIGHNNLLITPRFGPRVRLASMVTDVLFESDSLFKNNFCLHCQKPCIEACPAGAVAHGGQLSKGKCRGHSQPFGSRKMISFIQELIESDGLENKLVLLKTPRALELLELHQFTRAGGTNCVECMRVCTVGKR